MEIELNKHEELENTILSVIDRIEDEFLHQCLYQQGLAYIEQIDNSLVRSDRRILCLEARLMVFNDPYRSEQMMSSQYELDPYFFRNTFEYLKLLCDCFEDKSKGLMDKIYSQISQLKFKEDDGYYLACLGFTYPSSRVAGNLRENRRLLRRALQNVKKPFQKADILSQIGNTYLEMDNLDKAIEFYKKGLTYQPKNDECLNNLCFCYLEMQAYDTSIYYGETSLLNYPYNSTVLCNLAIVYTETNQIDKAEEAYIKLIQNKSTGSVQHANYAQFLFDFRDYDPLKRPLVFKNLQIGFEYSPTLNNPNILAFLELIKNAQSLYLFKDYSSVIALKAYLESIRLLAPTVLFRFQRQLNKCLLKLINEQEDEQFEDINPNVDYVMGNTQEDYLNNQNNQYQGEQATLDFSTHPESIIDKQIQTYQLFEKLIRENIEHNQTILSLSAYNKYIVNELHFQNDKSLWDLYID